MTGRALASTLLVLLAGCSEQWTGYAYPSRDNLSFARNVGTFDNLQSCRAAAINALRQMESDLLRGDYECGLNCRGSMCDRTER